MIGGTAISTISASGFRSRVFQNLVLKAVAADIRRSDQHLVHGIHAPASAVARSDARLVKMFGDRFDAHWPGRTVAFARQAEDQAHGFGLDGIDLQRLLGAVAALLGC